MKLSTIAATLVLSAAAVPSFAAGNLADVTVYDRAAGRILPTYYSDGRWYVAGKPGNEYEIRIRNQSGGDLLAVTSVDGVNVITGETASPAQSGYVLGPGDRLPIKGWRKDLSKVAAFYFTRLDDSYAARTGRPDNVGVIGVAVFKRKVEPPMVFEEEQKRREAPLAGAAKDSAPAATPMRHPRACRRNPVPVRKTPRRRNWRRAWAPGTGASRPRRYATRASSASRNRRTKSSRSGTTATPISWRVA